MNRERPADWFFDPGAVRLVLTHWAEMQKDTVTRLGLADGKIDCITISKQKSQLPQNDRVLTVVAISSSGRKGVVVYDADTNLVDIIKPRSDPHRGLGSAASVRNQFLALLSPARRPFELCQPRQQRELVRGDRATHRGRHRCELVIGEV